MSVCFAVSRRSRGGLLALSGDDGAGDSGVAGRGLRDAGKASK